MIVQPVDAEGFDGTTLKVKHCCAGPESSACTTTDGSVWVWGAISYNLFDQGRKYKGKQQCTQPVPLKPKGLQGAASDRFLPEGIAVSNTELRTTIAREKIFEELDVSIRVLKNRSSDISRQKSSAQAMQKSRAGDSDELGKEDLNLMKKDWE